MENLIQTIADNAWAALMIVLFFGGSIFVHELGHFLAAKWRGLHIERFSIGFGPRLFGWTRNGIDYRVSLLPLGGYVALPQLADMRGIEGESSIDTNTMPPISYTSKVIVAVAGAVFNILFALALGLILWKTGVQREGANTIGDISEQIEIAEGEFVQNPAAAAGLKIGDKIVGIDGEEIRSFEDIFIGIALGSGVTDEGKRKAEITYIRDGKQGTAIVHPVLNPDHELRMIGIAPNRITYIGALTEGFPAEEAGLLPGDLVREIDGMTIYGPQHFIDIVQKSEGRELRFTVERVENEETVTKNIPVTPVLSKFNISDDQFYAIGTGLSAAIEYYTAYVNPIELSIDVVKRTYQTLKSLVNRNSDAKLSDMSGPVGIANIIAKTSAIGIVRVMEIALMINISLAIFNLLPIPVLDGGHIAFATIAKITGKPIPPSFAAAIQGSFMILLFSFMLYVSYHDIGRLFTKEQEASNQKIELIKVEDAPA